MTARTPAQRKEAQRARQKKSGLVRVEVRVPAGTEGQIKALAEKLNHKAAS